MGDDHGIDIDDVGDRKRQVHHRIALFAIHSSRKPRKAVTIGQHRIDEEADASIVEPQGGIADLGECGRRLGHVLSLL